jgi:hypothetical protein
MKLHKKLIIALLPLVALAIVLSVTLAGAAAPSAAPEPAHTASISIAPGTPAQSSGAAAAMPTAAAVSTEPAVILSADFAVLYSSLAQLKDAADVVVRGQVTDVSYLDFNSTAYTEVTLAVTKCLKGDFAAGDEITIVEVGGVTTMATVEGDKFGSAPQADADTKVSVQLEGAPLTQVGDKCVYFLGTGTIGVVPGTYYVPLGAFQGRFKVDNGVAKRFVPSDWQSGKYTALPIAAAAVDQTVTATE